MQFAIACVLAVAVASVAAVPKPGRINEVWSRAEEDRRGVVRSSNTLPLPRDYIKATDLPASFNWMDINGTNYLTKSLNQHIPQYCGSCWAHGALSALADRIKIARKAKGIDIDLSIQYILNCGTAGSCHGGSATATYEYIHRLKDGKGVPYDTCQPYLACSSESREGICPHADFSCSDENVCRTCSTFPPAGKCVAIDEYPNATVANYGELRGEDDIAAEIYARGPVAAGIDASQILEYTGGVAGKGAGCQGIDHIVSIVGWGVDNGQKYWIVRNSWGEYWGELGYVRVAKGNNDLCLEDAVSWATPKYWTEHNYPCYEGGDNCQKSAKYYVDPAHTRRHPVLDKAF